MMAGNSKVAMKNDEVSGCQITLFFDVTFEALAKLFNNTEITPEVVKNLWNNEELWAEIDERITVRDLLTIAYDIIEIDVGDGLSI